MTGDNTAAKYEFKGRAAPESLSDVHELVSRAKDDNPAVAERDIMLFEIGLIEVANNIVKHSQPRGNVDLRVLLIVDPNELAAELVDNGAAVMFPIHAEMPDALATHGRGIPLARATLDEMTLNRVAEENHWHLKRKLRSAVPG